MLLKTLLGTLLVIGFFFSIAQTAEASSCQDDPFGNIQIGCDRTSLQNVPAGSAGLISAFSSDSINIGGSSDFVVEAVNNRAESIEGLKFYYTIPEGLSVDNEIVNTCNGEAQIFGGLVVVSDISLAAGADCSLTLSLGGPEGFYISSGDDFYAFSSITLPDSAILKIGNPSYQTSVSVNGSGSVSSTPAGIDCGEDCQESWVAEEVVQLTAIADPGNAFWGWSPNTGCANYQEICEITVTKNINIVAEFRPEKTLIISKSGQGLVRAVAVESDYPSDIDCGAVCEGSAPQGSSVTLEAVPEPGFAFSHWAGDASPSCDSSGDRCRIEVGEDVAVEAVFASAVALQIDVIGPVGGGSVSSPGFSCSASCTILVPENKEIEIDASLGFNSYFADWGNPLCDSNKISCTLVMDQPRSITPEFVSGGEDLQVFNFGTGTGRVVSSSGEIDCGSRCSARVALNKQIILTAEPDFGVSFDGWNEEECLVIANTCTLAMDEAKSLAAVFSAEGGVRVEKAGRGGGTVVSTPEGINCGEDCQEVFPLDSTVTLTATPAEGSEFAGWEGGVPEACLSENICQFSADRVRNIIARFIPEGQLSVGLIGTGTGRVESDPGGINCGQECLADFQAGASVTLTAEPSESSYFGGWRGDLGECQQGNPVCTLTMSQARFVEATFLLRGGLVSANLGRGFGKVASWPRGCPDESNCDAVRSFSEDTEVTLVALAGGGDNYFAGWSGNVCQGSNTVCTFVADGGQKVALAEFQVRGEMVIEFLGGGQGRVLSSPQGIDCNAGGVSCSHVFDENETVTLTAIAEPGSFFAGWSGDIGECSPNNTVCEDLTMNEARQISARFTSESNLRSLQIQKTGSGGGTVVSAPEGINCGDDCQEEAPFESTVILTATPSSNSVFTGWSGDIGQCDPDNPVCSVFMDQPRNITAQFTIRRNLQVSRSGGGVGSVISTPDGINCGVECNEDFPGGSSVTLTASPGIGSVFARWDGDIGDCQPANPVCALTMNQARSIDAQFVTEGDLRSLQINKSGSGSVISSPGGIDCGEDCQENFVVDTNITVTADAAPGWAFIGWSGQTGGCDEESTQCSFAMSQNREIDALFVPLRLLEITKSGLGQGVVSSPAGIDCGEDCQEEIPSGRVLTLTAVADPGSAFKSWSGNIGSCQAGNPICQVTMDEARSIDAQFVPSRNLQVTKSGLGFGVVASPSGINCGADCQEDLPIDSEVSLTATPDSGSAFTGWSGDGEQCGSEKVCTVTMNEAKLIVANFAQARLLRISKSGSGGGTITSSPEGIDCGEDCEEDIAIGSSVTITAAPDGQSIFAGWSGETGSCQINNLVCTLSMNQARTIDAQFIAKRTLQVETSGVGGGTVTSSPSGINCGSSCQFSFTLGSNVTLTASAEAGSSFTGWSGDIGSCQPTSTTCTVTMNQARTIGASFTLTRLLRVTKSGTGQGTVTSTPAGINCGTSCQTQVTNNTTVTLTASPGLNSVFSGWEGDIGNCPEGTPSCTLTMSQARTVNAVFTITRNLRITKSGTGAGTVVSNPVGINCGTDCQENFVGGISVTLTATASSGSSFTGWSGDIGSCQDTNPVCTLTISQAGVVDAQFAIRRNLRVTKSGTGSGRVLSSPAGIDCGEDCQEDVLGGSNITLTATASPGSVFTGWSGDIGACQSDNSVCSLNMGQARVVNAQFAKDWSLSVSKNGRGVVSSSPGGIDCGSDCQENYRENILVTLTAAPENGYQIQSWGGACSGSSRTCQVLMNSVRDVSINFVPLPKPPGNPKLNISVAAPAKVQAAKAFKVTIRLGNRATDEQSSAKNLKTCISIPVSFIIIKIQGSGSEQGINVCWSRSSLAANKEIAYTTTIRSIPSYKGRATFSTSSLGFSQSDERVRVSAKKAVSIQKKKKRR